MMQQHNLSEKDRFYLRELAKKQLEYSSLPVMEERKSLWYKHNSLQGEKPVIVMEMTTFEDEMLPFLRCETEAARNIEKELLRSIINHEMIDDDKVVPSYFAINNWDTQCQMPGIDIERSYAEDSQGKKIGYHQEHPIKDLKDDFHLLKPSVFIANRDITLARKAFAEEVFGDILPVRIKNKSLDWFFTPTAKIIELMGMEAMLYAMVDYPDEMHALMAFLKDDLLAFAKWQEAEGLLTLNNGNDYAGAGSYGFTTELPAPGYQENGKVTLKDLWVNMNSQETVGISPGMYGEFILPYYQAIAKEFGLVYYGCCEPVHDIWHDYVSKLQGLRKVSISAWCNEELIGEALKGGNVIYSRKPSPNYVGVGRNLDEEAFGEHIKKTLKAAEGCKIEFIFRDIYALNGELSKPARAVQITREMIDRYYK